MYLHSRCEDFVTLGSFHFTKLPLIKMPEFDFKIYRNLIGRLSKLVLDDSRKDVIFTFEGCGTTIKAHKNILEAVSSVFKTMFSGKFAEKEEVKITEIRPEIFQLLIKYSNF